MMRARFLVAGTLAGGIVLCVLTWFTAAALPPRFKQFTDARAVADAIRANTTEDNIYTAPQGLFVSVSLRSPVQALVPRIMSQFAVEFGVALGLSSLLLATRPTPPLHTAGFLGLMGLVAGVETHFPTWNWEGFPTSHLLAGCAYLAGNWFIAGLVLGAIRRRISGSV